MSTLYRLKPAFQNLLRPLCRGLVTLGVTANQVTLSAMALSALCGAAIVAWPQQRTPWPFKPFSLAALCSWRCRRSVKPSFPPIW